MFWFRIGALVVLKPSAALDISDTSLKPSIFIEASVMAGSAPADADLSAGGSLSAPLKIWI